MSCLLAGHSTYLVCSPCSPVGAPDGLSAISLREQLQQKQRHHDLLLAALSTGNVLPRLDARTSRQLFEHGEMLAAVSGALETQACLAEEPGPTSNGGGDGEWRVLLVHQLTSAAVCACYPQVLTA